MTNGPRIIDAELLRTRVGLQDMIEPAAHAFRQSSRRLADNGLLTLFPGARPDLGDVYVKTGVIRGSPVFIVKISPWFAVNAIPDNSQGGFVAVFDSNTGHTLALLDDQHYLSDLRTAAAGAIAARVLAPAKIQIVTVLGAGTQAYWQPQALFTERPFGELIIWARNEQKAQALKMRLAPLLPGVRIDTMADIEIAVRRADVVITATQSRSPLVRGEWLHPGQHITAVGADDPTKCELEASVLRRARVFVDSVDAALSNGDVHRAIQNKQYGIDDLAGEIGHVLNGMHHGREKPTDITVAKLVGIGAQDLVAAEVALRLCTAA
jgi:ornithine cyclodeaminase